MQHPSVPAPLPLTTVGERPCQEAPRGNTFKNTVRKHLDATYNLQPDYGFCHDFSALEGLSLPTPQKLGGEGGGYRESIEKVLY